MCDGGWVCMHTLCTLGDPAPKPLHIQPHTPSCINECMGYSHQLNQFYTFLVVLTKELAAALLLSKLRVYME